MEEASVTEYYHIYLSSGQLVPCPSSSSREADLLQTLPACRTVTINHHAFPSPATMRKIICEKHFQAQSLTLDRDLQRKNIPFTGDCFPFTFCTFPFIFVGFRGNTLFLWAFNDAYRTVPLKPAAALCTHTSPAALVYCRAKPKSNMYTLCFVVESLPMAKLD